MPVSYHIDVKRDLVLTTASGILTDEDVLEHKAKLTNDTLFKPGMKELSDLRFIDRLAVTPDGVRAMVQKDSLDKVQLVSHKLAIIVSQDLAFGMARMYQTLTQSNLENVGIFRSIEDARVWLQVE
jgi:hypothetical protein